MKNYEKPFVEKLEFDYQITTGKSGQDRDPETGKKCNPAHPNAGNNA